MKTLVHEFEEGTGRYGGARACYVGKDRFEYNDKTRGWEYSSKKARQGELHVG